MKRTLIITFSLILLALLIYPFFLLRTITKLKDTMASYEQNTLLIARALILANVLVVKDNTVIINPQLEVK